MLRNLSLIGGLLVLAACFPDLSQYEGEGAAATGDGATSTGTPTSSSASSAASTPSSSSAGGDGGSGASGPSGGGDPSTGGGGTGPGSSTDSSSSSGGGGGAVDPCTAPLDRPLVQDGALIEGDSLGTPYAFCMDQAEVTLGSYKTFFNRVEDGELDLAAFYDTKAACDWKEPTAEALVPNFKDLLVGDWNDVTTHKDLPIVSVDYCDAAAYCEWAGKRLCGGIDGPVGWKQDQTENEWFLACSHGAERIYPYNQDGEYDPGELNCGGSEPDEESCPAFEEGRCKSDGKICTGWRGTWTEEEGAGCAAFDPRVVNLSGNVAEWTDACSPDDGSHSPDSSSGWFCETRGGSCPLHFYTSCYYAGSPAEDDADNKASTIGFRCCWDPADE